MQLTITSTQGVIFKGEVTKTSVSTGCGVITILPNHAPLGTIVDAGILSFVPKDKKENAFIKGTDFLFQDDAIFISIGNGILYMDGEHITILISGATINPKLDIEELEKIKIQLQKDIQEIRTKGNIDEIEKAYLSLQRITADLHLKRMRHG